LGPIGLFRLDVLLLSGHSIANSLNILGGGGGVIKDTDRLRAYAMAGVVTMVTKNWDYRVAVRVSETAPVCPFHRANGVFPGWHYEGSCSFTEGKERELG